MNHKLILVIIVLLFADFCDANLTLSIIHFNDFHSRYEPSNITCANHCHPPQTFHNIGGFSRLYSSIKRLSSERTNPLVLNAGDNFQGSLWFVIYRWNVTQHFLNWLKLDAITLGNHEFDNGIEDLALFLSNVKAPIAVANIDVKNEPKLNNLIRKSIVVRRGGRKIGIIGAITTDTQHSSNTGKVIFLDESSSVNREAGQLIHDQNVFTNILLSHCGFDQDLKIAANSTQVSLIVGGHTDTFLYSGTTHPGPDKVVDSYPKIVKNQDGKPVLIVQASAYGKYLGDLIVKFDETGFVKEYSGNPIFLDENIKSNAIINEELKRWKSGVDLEGDKIIGTALFEMDDKICRVEECLIGNFITDAMVFNYINQVDDNISWTFASIAMMHAGGIRNRLPKGDITFNHLISTFPFQDNINVVEIKGRDLREIFEKNFDNHHLKFPHYLQVSGIRLVANLSKLEGHRVNWLKIRCRTCQAPKYEDINLDNNYRIILPGFLTDFDVINPLIKKYAKNKTIGKRDSDIYLEYFKHRSPIFAEIEGRITVVD